MSKYLGKTWYRRTVSLGEASVMVLEKDKDLSNAELAEKVRQQINFLILMDGEVTLFGKDSALDVKEVEVE